MHQRLPPLPPPQAPLPCTNHPRWAQLPTDRRQQCHELLAQRLIHVSPSAPSEAGTHEHQDDPTPSPT